MTMKTASKPHRPGIIRITLKKPMGIVFKPITEGARDDGSLDVGAKIKDLPKHGDAAKSGQLDVGDELLSIDDEFTTNLKFDDIMNIIVKEKKSLSLLFRKAPEKPKPVFPKESTQPSQAHVSRSKHTSEGSPKKKNNYDEKALQVLKQAVNERKEKRRDDDVDDSANDEINDTEEVREKKEGRGKDDSTTKEDREVDETKEKDDTEIKDEQIKEENETKEAKEKEDREIQEKQAKEVANDTFVGSLIDTLCGPCGEDDPNTSVDLNQEADGFIYLTDKNTGIVQ